MIDVHVGELHAAARSAESSMTLSLVGTADTSAEAALNELLGRLHGELQKAGMRDVVVDMHDLEFMNSSCFKCFLSWITDIQELEQERQYRVKFVSNPQLHWQKRSLHSLRCFAVELITVVER